MIRIPPSCLAPLLLLLGGCSMQPFMPAPGCPWPWIASDSDSSVFEQAASLRKLSNPELAATAERLSRQHARERNEDSRLRLALFLSLAPAPHADRSRALQLLDLAPNGNSAGRNHPLAQLLLPLLQEQKRLEDTLAASQQRNRELQLNHDQMRQKLEAIREIEIKMLERTPAK
jgi:hypothetical protein